MKEIFFTYKTFGNPEDPGFGSWWERGHWENNFIKDLAAKKGMPEDEAYSVLLTRKEWEYVANGLGLTDDWSLDDD